MSDAPRHALELERRESYITGDGGRGVSSDEGGGFTREMEALGRGVVAVPSEGGILVRWRLLGTDPGGVGFHVYRDGERITDDPVTESTNYLDPDGESGATYAISSVVDGEEGEASAPVDAWDDIYKRIPLDRPDDVEHAGPNGNGTISYHANDANVGDLTGDGSLAFARIWSRY